ncbi:class I SAM-dependent methyltransferase [Pseudorhodoplanes sinuspersici]|uniref:SAM-dependent methyltransferase n=1 Tax=Pseudorhodoplanes sinuspersici TaxID=1235591 RepID=A0A1W6ZLT1_9HYPH|nr:class I SAM-dependent methyltransferase [Pseudorhodoplanes sinuspersici]ARP98321.1 SAM-dependent methyltransferase [Pseudorhodoplanes sinuspersici]RKE65977.1 methyltransferase family protein [Pseudorhodoplanes sinuspersici]
MVALKSSARLVAGSCVSIAFALNCAVAQPAPAFEPKVGQRGKDVVWVPTNQKLVDKMLDMAKVTANDYVMDLGSGDGRTVITAAKRGATAQGIEYNPDMVELSKKNAEKEGVTPKASFEKADLFETDFSKATVVTMFLLPSINLKLRPKLLDMKPGTRIVSNSFDLGDWTADQTESVGEECSSHCTAYFWIVPAKVEGTWQTPQGELKLEQKYQMVSGTLKNGNVIAPVTHGKLTGDQIAFTAAGTRYTGTVNGNAIEGKSNEGGKEAVWKATK